MTETELLFSWLAFAIMLMLSAFFSGSETSLTAITRARIRTLEKSGNKRAAAVSKLREEKEKLIGAILIGNNIVNIGASALATAVAIQMFGNAGVAYSTALVTFLILIFGEVLPKTYAIRHTDHMALAVAPIFALVVKLLSPFTALLYGIVAVLLKLIPTKGGPAISARDALRGTIEIQHEEGDIVKQDRDMLGSIIDLSERDIAEVMVHRMHVEMLNADLPAHEIIDAIIGSHHSRLPLWRGNPDNVIGVLHAKDVLRALRAANGDPAMVDIAPLVTSPWFIPDTTSMQDQLHAFRVRRSHFAIVVDEFGALEGIVTLEDILEEIVGHIDDEHDPFDADLYRQQDGSVIVMGDMTVRDINREMDWDLPDEEASTVAGLLIHEMRDIPFKGARHEAHGFEFEVLGRDGNQLTRLRITPLQPEA